MKALSIFMATCFMFTVASTSAVAAEDPAAMPDNGVTSEDVNMSEDPAMGEDMSMTEESMMTLGSGDVGAIGYSKYKWYCWYEDEDGQLYKGWGWSKYKAKYTAMKKCEFGYDSQNYHHDDDDDDDGYYGQYCEYFKCVKKKVM